MTSVSTTAAPDGSRRVLVTICTMAATIMQALDTTIANVALPYMQGSLSASLDQINWVLTSYIVAAAIMTAPIGWLSDRFGRKKLFVVCAAGFTVASVLCALAQDITQMVGFRLLQGVFGAALVPLSQAVMLDSYPPEERGSAMAIWGMGVMLAPIMGPTLGAWLTDNYSWHWVFLINLPIGIVTVIGLMLFIDESEPKAEMRFDWLGFVALAVGIGALQLMLDRGEQVGWFESNEIWAEAIISAAGFYFFLAHSLTTNEPFIRFALFKDRNFVAACLFMVVIGIVLFGTMALVTPVKTARVEAQRCVGTFTFSAVEARKLTGEMVPMEAGPAGEGKFGFVIPVPYGVVGAISPFNFPLNLVAHKLGPAIAAGNAVVLKPAGQTPVSAIKLAEILVEAGLPEGWLHVVCGSGSDVGDAIVKHELTGAITFTGSAPVGWRIRADVPQKKVNLELGSTAPLIVHEDGDWEDAADKAKLHAYSHAGQSCISVQRILVHEAVADEFTKRLVSNVESLVTGDPIDENTDVGPLISTDDRDRVKSWVDEAAKTGGEVLTGGELVDEDRCLAPTVLREPPKEAKVWCEEIFGPVATLHTYSDFDQAIALANDAKFGLQAGVYTRDIGRGISAGERLEFGGVLVNEVPTFRTDQMPYGGVKDSGNTREGPAYAVRELTEERLVTLQG